MYEHVTKFIEDIDEGRFSDAEFDEALYHPSIVNTCYRETLARYRLRGNDPWNADVEQLNLEATLALLTFVHRADHFNEGALYKAAEDGFLRRILVRLEKLEKEISSAKIIGFWKEKDMLGCCSNWHSAGFVFDGLEYKTSEHWMMWQKARVMDDMGSSYHILKADTPRVAKNLGGQVKNYDDELWDDVREQLVYYGVREKFLANPALASMLLATGSAVLCEASPYDEIWGIGMTADDPSFNDPSQWKGKNLLGRVCMRVRSDLRLCGGELPDRDRMVNDLFLSRVGGMSLLELSRIPAARPAVLCWVRVMLSQSRGTHGVTDVEEALAMMKDASLDMYYNYGDFTIGTSVGVMELLVQLAFLHHTGQL